jgi:GT2 family glycosyltransferase
VRLILDPEVRVYDRGRVLAARGRIIRLAAGGPAALRALLADTATPAQRALGERLLDAGFAHPRPTPRPGADVTIVIPVKDDRILPPIDHRTIVIDDGSKVPIAGAIRRPRAGGPAAARNTGLAHATTALVAFLDADTLPPPDWVERLAGHFDDPRVHAVAPRIRAANRRRSPLDMGPRRTVPYVPSAALIVRTPVRFDEALRYGEDVDLIWRLQDAGHRVVYDPSVVVLHHERHTVRRTFRYGTSAAPLARRHPTRLRHVVLHRPRPLALARLLHRKGVPRRVALVWTARSLEQSARGLAHLATPYGIGVAWGKIRGLPTISGPRIP